MVALSRTSRRHKYAIKVAFAPRERVSWSTLAMQLPRMWKYASFKDHTHGLIGVIIVSMTEPSCTTHSNSSHSVADANRSPSCVD